MVKPGALTDAQLTEIEDGIFLGTKAANAYRRLKADFRSRGKTLLPVGKYAAYRSNFIQHAMHVAGSRLGTYAERIKYKLNPNSSVSIADAPNGSHQDGNAFDFLLDGSSQYPSATDRAVFAKHGWRFQFGDDDPNHVRHNGIQSIGAVTRSWCIKNHIWVQPAKAKSKTKK